MAEVEQLVGPGVTAMLLIATLPLERMASSMTTLRAKDGPWLSTKTVQTIGVPANTVVSGLHSLLTCRSAESFTRAVSLAELFARFGSLAPLVLTVALSVMLVGPPALATVAESTSVTILKEMVWLAAMSPRLHVTTWPTAEQPAGGLRL